MVKITYFIKNCMGGLEVEVIEINGEAAARQLDSVLTNEQMTDVVHVCSDECEVPEEELN